MTDSLRDMLMDAGLGAAVVVKVSESGVIDLIAHDTELWDDVVANADEVEYISMVIGWGPYTALYRVVSNEYAHHYLVAERLYGVKEFAAALGWDTAKFTVYRTRGHIPEPGYELAMGPIWSEDQVRQTKERLSK